MLDSERLVRENCILQLNIARIHKARIVLKYIFGQILSHWGSDRKTLIYRPPKMLGHGH